MTWLSQKQVKSGLNLDAPVGVRMRDSFSLDPYRACVGIAAAAKRRGAVMFERSIVTKVRFGRKHVDVVADGGVIHAATVVVATGTATAEFRPLRRHFKRREMYQVLTAPIAAPVRKQLGPRDTVLKDARTPPHRLRWTGDDRLLVAGADQDETPVKTATGRARPAHRSIDVRAADDVSGHFRPSAGVRMGDVVRSRRLTA